MICKRSFVSGRVQGVFYRGSCAREAKRLGVTGYARNLPDGRVEVLACGSPDAVDTLLAWLAVGPSGARVTHVETFDAAHEERPAAFTTA
jgi:acylphosphatase